MQLPDPVHTTETDYEALFERQRNHAPTLALSSADERISRIKRVQAWIADHTDAITDALYRDFRKAPSEVILTELYGLSGELTYAIKHLRRWMKPQRVPTPIPLLGMRSTIRYEPKGNVLIIAPWNYPFVLC